jgi:hypothetical protein
VKIWRGHANSKCVRGTLLVASFVLLAPPTHALPGVAFLGEWQGEVEGIGEARLRITAVKSNGQVEGELELPSRSFIGKFDDKGNGTIATTSRAVVSGRALAIDTASGERYALLLEGNRLTGTYGTVNALLGKVALRSRHRCCPWKSARSVVACWSVVIPPKDRCA